MTTTQREMNDRIHRLPTTRVPSIVIVLGLGLVVLTIVEVGLALAGYGSRSPVFVGGVLTSLPISLATVAGGFWLERSTIGPERYGRVGWWILGGLSFFTSFTVLIGLAVSEGLLVQLATVRWGTAIGTGSGFLIGVFEARSIEKAVAAQRIRATELERRRELLHYLNGILRHEILNSTNVIQGYADLIHSTNDTHNDVGEYAMTIKREAEDLTLVTADVRQLLETADASRDRHAVPLDECLQAELEALRASHSEATIETSIPADIEVRADDMLGRLLSNLLENAVEHNDGDPELSVRARRNDSSVRLEVADNGPGIPDSERENLFDPRTRSDTSHGMGLTIVAMLAERYDGEVEVAETGVEGTVFAVDLPLAEAS